MARTSKPHPNTVSTESPAIANRDGSVRWRSAGYWLAIVSHLSTGYDLNELPLLAVLTALTVPALGTTTPQPSCLAPDVCRISARQATRTAC